MCLQARKPKYQKKEPRKTRKRSSPQRPVIPDLCQPPPQRIPVVSRPVTKRSVRKPGGRASDDQDDFRNPITDQSIIFPLPQELQYLSKVNNSSSSSLSSFYSSSSEDEPILSSPNSVPADSKSLAPIQLSVIKKIVKPPLEPPADSSADSACDSDAGKGRGQGDTGAGVRKVILGQR